jgi:phage terminase large subunit
VRFFDAKTRWNIIFGGASSGKSVFMAQLVVEGLLAGGRNFLCVRKYKNTLQGSVFNEIKKIISHYGMLDFFDFNRTTYTVTCATGCQAVLCGLDDAEKIKSITPTNGVFTDIWVEEATEIAEDDLRQLDKRLRGKADVGNKRIFLTFNPIIKSHWIFRKFFSGVWDDSMRQYHDDNITIQHATYLDNNFLAGDDATALEGEADKLSYDVYTLGRWGVLGEGIFRNWAIDNLAAVKDEYSNVRNGLDFGFVHPAAFVRLDYNSALGEVRIFDEAGGSGMHNQDLATLVSPIVGKEVVMCDSAEPKSISELRSAGINAMPVKKSKGKIGKQKTESDYTLYCIQWLSALKHIVVDELCVNTINNLQLYHWQVDRRTGETMPVPVKRDDDFFPDAAKYALNRDMFGQTKNQQQNWGVKWL